MSSPIFSRPLFLVIAWLKLIIWGHRQLPPEIVLCTLQFRQLTSIDVGDLQSAYISDHFDIRNGLATRKSKDTEPSLQKQPLAVLFRRIESDTYCPHLKKIESLAIFIKYLWNVNWQNCVSVVNVVEKQLSRCSLLKWQPCFPLCITSVHSNSRITSNPNLALPQTSGQGFWLKGFWLIPSYLQQNNKSLVIRKYMPQCWKWNDILLPFFVWPYHAFSEWWMLPPLIDE